MANSFEPNSRAEVLDRFASYKVSEEGLEQITETRERITDLADYLYRTLPASREKSLALTKLEEVSMFANKATSRQHNTAGAE